jgi:WD40 repeat protein
MGVWDALSGTGLVDIHSVEGRQLTDPIVVSPDGEMITSTVGLYDSTICIWQLNASSWSLDIQTGDNQILSLAFFPNGRHIIAISIYRIWTLDVISGNMISASDEQKGMYRMHQEIFFDLIDLNVT